jgi:hypothetical protein
MKITAHDAAGVSNVSFRGTLLDGLPSGYEIVTAIIRSASPPLSDEVVRTILRTQFEALESRTAALVSTETMAMAASQRDQRHIKCYSCNRNGHYADACPNRLGSPRGGSRGTWCSYHKTPCHDSSECCAGRGGNPDDNEVGFAVNFMALTEESVM